MSLPKNPSIGNGQPDGPALSLSPDEPSGQAQKPNDVPTPSSEPDLGPPGVQAHLLGIPDSLPETNCPNCKVNVLPRGKGQCPRCGRVLKMSFNARTKPINTPRRNAILAALIAEFPPADMLERATTEQLADTLERIEGLKAGSADWHKSVETSQKLGAALRQAKQSRVAKPSNDNLEPLSYDQLIERMERLLKGAREDKAHAERIERANAESAARSSARPNSTNEVREEKRSDAPASPAAPREEQLSRALWPSVGVHERAGIVSHPLGDEHAQKILSGQIPFQQAQAEERKRQADLHAMADGTR